jgi:L-ribulokinase
MTVVAGIDFGTASVRVSIVDAERGALGTGTADFPVLRRSADASFATQRHEDHCRALIGAFTQALRLSKVKGSTVRALALDTTGSTVVPLDEHLQPLDDYYLWCDRRAWREAAEITSHARNQEIPALAWCGGSYSPEWGFAKTLHWLRTHPGQRARFYTVAEHCDFMVGTLCGVTDPRALSRSVCAMGHKWMWNRELGGLPSEAFWTSVDPLLAGLRERLEGRYLTADQVAGHLSDRWASELGLAADIPVVAGALDAHWDAIGTGCRIGDVTNVIGTSSCVMALSDERRLIPGVSGVVPGSIDPRRIGIEAGLAAVGDLFDAIARRASANVTDLAMRAQNHRAGQTGLIRIAWDNGDRCVLADAQARGVTLGWRLNHTAADEFFAAIEGTAFHTRIILERLEEHGVPIQRVIHAGGIPQTNEGLNRVYASVLGKAILVPARSAVGMGSAIFAFLAVGTFKAVEEAQDALAPKYRTVEPNVSDVPVYEELFQRFRHLYFLLAPASRARN